MMVFRRNPPRSHTRTPLQATLWLGLFAASVHAGPLTAFDAADPARSSTAPPALALPAPERVDPQPLPADLAAARAVWQRANQRVAEFPRGHADLLRWESRQPAGPAPGTGNAPPALDLAQALRLSLRQRPELFTHADMNALARARVQAAYAAHLRDLQRAWIEAVSARQSERLQAEVLDAAHTGSELGRRTQAAGSWSQARLLREQLVEASAWQASAQARGASLAAQERLALLLGVWEAQAVASLGDRLPTSLPEPPARATPGEALSETTLEAAVLRSHPTLAAQRLQARREGSAPNAERRQAWDTAVDAALAGLPAPGQGPHTPPHLDTLGLLRDETLARAVAAEALLLRVAAERRSMARQAWTTLQLRHATALHAQRVVVELQAALAQETLLRHNGMLLSSWALLASARERMASLDAAQQARRDYWLAQADWQALLSGAEHLAADTTPPAGPAAPTAAH